MSNLSSWQKVLRDGLFPQLSTEGLLALRKGLQEDDSKLIQGATTTPPPMQCVLDWPIEGACLIGYCGWQGDGLKTVGEVEEFFAETCFEADRALGEPAAVRYLLNWFDDCPRDEMRIKLGLEIDDELALRGVYLCPHCHQVSSQTGGRPICCRCGRMTPTVSVSPAHKSTKSCHNYWEAEP